MKQISNGAKHVRNYLMSWIAAFPWSRRLLNVAYNRFTPSQRETFHAEFSKIFRARSARGRDGSWEVRFAGNVIRIPLAAEQFWLDWDTAVSVIGQDLAIRETYEALISSPERPDLFIDIGANYGTHSLLFLVHRIKTLSFEPNSSCHATFRRLCEANRVTPTLEPVALGEKGGMVTLSYPRRDTWLGSTSAEVAERLAHTQDLVTEEVEQKTLDDYISRIGRRRTLIKIDTEGHELSVLRGAARTLHECKPYIVFECWNDAQRAELFNFFEARDYQICHIPWRPARKAPPLTLQQFSANPAVDYIAIPIQGA